MNKRGILKFVFVFIVTSVSFYFMINTSGIIDSIFNLTIALDFLITLTIYMYLNKNKIKKNKFIYDVILMLMMIFSALYIFYFIYSIISYSFSPSYNTEWNFVFAAIYPIFLFLMILFGLGDITHKTNKENDILTIIVSILILLIHASYYLEPNFVHKLTGNHSFDSFSYDYIAQNYIYFVIMYFVTFVHYIVNRTID